MKIWILTSEFPPSYGGGISTYCIETARMLAGAGNTVLVITQDKNVASLTIEKKEQYEIARFNPMRYFTSSFLGHEANLSYAFAQAVKELAQEKGAPDVVESQEYMGIAYYLLQYKWLGYPLFSEMKVALTLHAPSFLYLEYNKVPIYQLPYFWIGEMERFCIRAADMLISPSAYLVEELKSRMTLDDRKVHVLKNPYAIPRSVTAPGKRDQLVFFGKLIPQKGCLELLEYFRKLWNEGFDQQLVMIGGGDHLFHPEGVDMIDFIKDRYRTEISSGMLKLLGSVKPADIAGHLQNAKAVIVPSIVDNLPYTVLEAMGDGHVLLASRQGGQAEVISNGEDGFLFDHNIPGSFADQVKNILALQGPALDEIRKAAVKKVEALCSYDIIYPQKIRLLEQLAGSTGGTVFPFTRPAVAPLQLHPANAGTRDLLSVVIPYYNMGDYIEDAIRSVRSCTYKNVEIIVVDDGSSGSHARILDELAGKYGLDVLRDQNQGLSQARNHGAARARGEYLCFLDPDDTVEPSYYEKAIEVLKRYDNVYFAGCWAKYFDGAEGFWPAFNPEPPFLLFHNMINSSALIYKRVAFMRAGLNDQRMIYGMEDYDSVISMVEQGYQGVALPEPLWNYRIRKNSMARGFTREKQLYLYRLIAGKHKILFSKFGADLAGLLNANGPGYKIDNPTLSYTIPTGFLNGRMKHLLISRVRSSKLLRKVYIKLKKHYST
jgi:glycosyltransferase involved in cell wall biosynthesis